MRVAQVGDPCLAATLIRRIRQHELLAQRDFRRKHHEGTMRTDSHRERLFEEGAMICRLATDDDRQVHQYAFTPSLRCLGHLTPFLCSHYDSIGCYCEK
jgi:hypothetical protein